MEEIEINLEKNIGKQIATLSDETLLDALNRVYDEISPEDIIREYNLDKHEICDYWEKLEKNEEFMETAQNLLLGRGKKKASFTVFVSVMLLLDSVAALDPIYVITPERWDDPVSAEWKWVRCHKLFSVPEAETMSN